MRARFQSVLVWTPRLAGIAVSLFLALFALDAFDGRPLVQTIPAFAVHLLPAAIVAAAVWFGWRHPWVGAVAFAALAVGYAAMVPTRLDWILAISGPLGLTAVLFALGATRGAKVA
jgi:hypothetical protein